MTSLQERRRRVEAGSRRKRDLAAVENVAANKRIAREAELSPKVEQTRSAEFAWELAVQLLADHLPETTTGLWIAPVTCRGEVDGELYLASPTGWCNRLYGQAIREAIRSVSDFKGGFISLAKTEGEEWQ